MSYTWDGRELGYHSQAANKDLQGSTYMQLTEKSLDSCMARTSSGYWDKDGRTLSPSTEISAVAGSHPQSAEHSHSQPFSAGSR
ncbi:hypothetical protein BDN71DRAFT_1440747 [Pleurotus eryngii]|uniref:Uncharacterized protein n=1 Tax=Pleurotus eryngii TaxID=5323 RepID=A0A9P6AAG9_PLEER|nr:hypothetical protein BDN71DRAFT_1440747 [Pleurotus eryngii]